MKITFEKPKSCTERFKEGKSLDDGLSGAMRMRGNHKYVNTHENHTRQKPEEKLHEYTYFG